MCVRVVARLPQSSESKRVNKWLGVINLNCSVYSEFHNPKCYQTLNFFPKVAHFIWVKNPHKFLSFVDIFLKSGGDTNERFSGNSRRLAQNRRLFSGYLNETFEIFQKFNNFIEILVKKHEVWYPTCGYFIKRRLSQNRFVLPWTVSKCIFCLKGTATIITNLKKYTSKWL